MTKNNLEQIILTECREWLGTPYQHQGSLKQVGCDCLGLLRGVWRHLYGSEPQKLPRYTSDWGEVDRSEPLLTAVTRYLNMADQISPSHVLLFRWRPELPAKHLGIVSSQNTFIHAFDRVGVIESTLGPHWRKKLVGVFSFPSLNSLKAD